MKKRNARRIGKGEKGDVGSVLFQATVPLARRVDRHAYVVTIITLPFTYIDSRSL